MLPNKQITKSSIISNVLDFIDNEKEFFKAYTKKAFAYENIEFMLKYQELMNLIYQNATTESIQTKCNALLARIKNDDFNLPSELKNPLIQIEIIGDQNKQTFLDVLEKAAISISMTLQQDIIDRYTKQKNQFIREINDLNNKINDLDQKIIDALRQSKSNGAIFVAEYSGEEPSSVTPSKSRSMFAGSIFSKSEETLTEKKNAIKALGEKMRLYKANPYENKEKLCDAFANVIYVSHGKKLAASLEKLAISFKLFDNKKMLENRISQLAASKSTPTKTTS